MGTKTEDYLKKLAEGGDAPVSCCMTNTQKLIAEAIERVNNLIPLPALTITIGEDEYIYDGTQAVSLTILDGENTEF